VPGFSQGAIDYTQWGVGVEDAAGRRVITIDGIEPGLYISNAYVRRPDGYLRTRWLGFESQAILGADAERDPGEVGVPDFMYVHTNGTITSPHPLYVIASNCWDNARRDILKRAVDNRGNWYYDSRAGWLRYDGPPVTDAQIDEDPNLRLDVAAANGGPADVIAGSNPPAPRAANRFPNLIRLDNCIYGSNGLTGGGGSGA
jgi:hypothetical protein